MCKSWVSRHGGRLQRKAIIGSRAVALAAAAGVLLALVDDEVDVAFGLLEQHAPELRPSRGRGWRAWAAYSPQVLDDLVHLRSEDIWMIRLLPPARIDALDAELRTHRDSTVLTGFWLGAEP